MYTSRKTLSVSFHANLETIHVFGDVVDDEGFCHIESRKLLWWTPDEEREIGRAYEAMVYLMETGKHDKEEDGTVDSCRGLEKRTEDGAWRLYETQRDFRNVVLCEQDRLKDRGVTDVSAIALHLADACKDLSAAALQCAYQMAQQDTKAVEAYLRDRDGLSSRACEGLDVFDEARTSPLKSVGFKCVVPWVRHVSMPLTDTIEKKALKASVDDKPVQKEAMTLAAKSVLESRQVPDAQAPDATDVPAKKKKKKNSSYKAESKADEKVKNVKKIKKKSKAVKAIEHQENATALEDEIRLLEKEVAKREADKARELAKQMSLGFVKEMGPKKTSKQASTATLQEAPPSRRASIKEGKSTKRKIKLKKILGPSLSDLNASSDFSTVPPASESSASSFEHDDDEVTIKETKTMVRGHRKQLSLFPRLRKKHSRKHEESSQEEKSSCHF